MPLVRFSLISIIIPGCKTKVKTLLNTYNIHCTNNNYVALKHNVPYSKVLYW